MKSVLLASQAFYDVAQNLFAPFDTSLQPRAFSAEKTLSDLSSLTEVQADFLRQGVRSVENGLFRGAIVISFCAISDIAADLAVARSVEFTVKKSIVKYSKKEELLEAQTDYQIADVLRLEKVITKSSCKTIHSLLHRRNQCAHPTKFSPNADEALGYIRECMRALEELSRLEK